MTKQKSNLIAKLIRLTDKQHQALKDESDDTGLSMNELIRRAVDKYIEDIQEKRQRISRD